MSHMHRTHTCAIRYVLHMMLLLSIRLSDAYNRTHAHTHVRTYMMIHNVYYYTSCTTAHVVVRMHVYVYSLIVCDFNLCIHTYNDMYVCTLWQ